MRSAWGKFPLLLLWDVQQEQWKVGQVYWLAVQQVREKA